MKKLIFIIPLILILGAAVLLILLNQNKTGPNNFVSVNKKINIVAVENFYADMATQIGGSKVNVISILANPNLDPHEYETTSNDARNVSDADIVIENGLGYDSFVDRLLANTDNKIVIDVGQLAGLNDGDNPHIWYNLNHVKTFAAKLRDELSKLDPTNRTFYQNNYRDFINSLSPLENVCRNIKDNYNGTAVISTEPVADYLVANCGLSSLKSGFQKAIEEGTDPSFTDISDFENALTTHRAKVLIYNNQTPTPTTEKERTLAVNNGIPVVGVSETMPAGTNYISWMVGELTDLNNALKND